MKFYWWKFYFCSFYIGVTLRFSHWSVYTMCMLKFCTKLLQCYFFRISMERFHFHLASRNIGYLTSVSYLVSIYRSMVCSYWWRQKTTLTLYYVDQQWATSNLTFQWRGFENIWLQFLHVGKACCSIVSHDWRSSGSDVKYVTWKQYIEDQLI